MNKVGSFFVAALASTLLLAGSCVQLLESSARNDCGAAKSDTQDTHQRNQGLSTTLLAKMLELTAEEGWCIQAGGLGNSTA